MGAQGDFIDEFDCSDQRLIFRLVLAELRRVRKANFLATCKLISASENCRVEALEILEEVSPSAKRFAQVVKTAEAAKAQTE